MYLVKLIFVSRLFELPANKNDTLFADVPVFYWQIEDLEKVRKDTILVSDLDYKCYPKYVRFRIAYDVGNGNGEKQK